MLRSRRKKLVAVVVGVLLAGAPLAGFNIWLDRVIQRQGLDDIAGRAQRSIAQIEARLGQVVVTLEALAAQAVDSCRPGDMEKLRRAAFATLPIKELSVIGDDGQTVCSNVGIPLGARQVLNKPRAVAPGGMLIEIVRLGDRAADFVRLRRPGSAGAGLAALVPVDEFLPQTSTQGDALGVNARVFTGDGLLIGEAGAPRSSDMNAEDLLIATAWSDRFGITAKVSMPPGAVDASDLRAVGAVVNSLAAIGFLSLAWLFVRKYGGTTMVEIERAIEAKEFVPYYQPIIDITSGKVLGAEALARWRKPDGTLVSPTAFIPLVEQSRLIFELTRSLMRQACAEIGEAYARRPHLKIGFNLTARHFANDAVIADLHEIFDRSPIDFTQVVLELTERQPPEDLTATRRVIAALQGLGCRVALDDVGTGHSGLSSILKLGVDTIKIDKMFVDSLGSERNSATIVDTMVELARNMGMEVVAEGVESFDQVADLRARGIRAAQGFVFAPPLPGSSFLLLLDALDPGTRASPPAEQPAERAA